MKVTIKYEFDTSCGVPYAAWAHNTAGKAIAVGCSETSFEEAELRLMEKLKRQVGVVVPEPKKIEI